LYKKRNKCHRRAAKGKIVMKKKETLIEKNDENPQTIQTADFG